MSKKYDAVRLRAQDRLRWVDAMANDPKLNPMAFKVAAKIGSHFNSITGETYGAQEKLSDWMSIGERTVRRAISKLVLLGYLIVIAPEASNFSKPKDRRRSNTYQPAINYVRMDVVSSAVIANDNVQGKVGANKNALELLDGCAANQNDSTPIDETERNQLAPSLQASSASKEGQQRPPAGGASRSDEEKHEVAGGLSTLNDPSDQYSSHAGARANVHEELLSKIMRELHREVGESAFKSRFSTTGFVIVSRDETTITFALRSLFLKDWIATHYDGLVLRCAKRICPTIERVDFVVAGAWTPGRSG